MPAKYLAMPESGSMGLFAIKPSRLTLQMAIFAMLSGFFGLLPSVTLAGTKAAAPHDDQVIDATGPKPWVVCELAALRVEATQKLPRALLASVALAESGRFVRSTGKTHSWPWTINAEGRAYYLPTRQAAVRKARELLDQGIRSMDVGCMQVNLRYHPKAFASLEDAFDPLTNMGYAALFLTSLSAQAGSWPKAIGRYHSQSPALNRPYFAKVIRIWENERPRLVRLSTALSAELASEESDASDTPAQDVADMAPVDSASLQTASIAKPVEPAERPAPMVLDAGDGTLPSESAIASVGLRLTIAEETFADAKSSNLPPRVLDPVAAAPRPTIMAQADVPGA
ncbi:MAG: hypothetical protein WBN97_08545 [Parvibaculum sp.]